MAIATADHLKEVVGLRNDIVYKVFVCPECKTEVTISRYQVAGDLDVMCARCNAKWAIKGDEIKDLNDGDREFMGYKVYIKMDENQRNVPAPDERPANADGVTPKQAETAAAAAAAKAAAPAEAKAEESKADSE